MSKVRCVFYGDYAVGKSSIISKAVCGTAPEEYDSTIEETYILTINHLDTTHVIDIIDTAPFSTDLAILLPQYAENADIFVVCYSITNRRSFEDVSKIYEQLIHGSKPTILVGNKCDAENQRKVTKNEGKDFADSIGALFFEVSAQTGRNAMAVFNAIPKLVATQY